MMKTYDILELLKLSRPELDDIAREFALNPEGKHKQELIYAILEKQNSKLAAPYTANKFNYFRHAKGNIFTAINLEDEYFICVTVLKNDTEILYRRGFNATNLRLTSCLSNDHIESTEEEFTKSIGEANAILHQTPFL